MGIKDWPPGERPREKLLQLGPRGLSDAELLAVLIHAGSGGRTALDLARDALSRAGDLRRFLDLEAQEMCAFRGIGRARHAQIKAGLELGKRYVQARVHRGPTLSGPAATRDFFSARLRYYPYEVFACLFLDSRHRVLKYEELFRGTIDGASVPPREVIRHALAHNAAAVIFAHNHPSGVAEPSEADRAITRRLVRALQLIDVRVLDHLVIGDAEATSFAERGLL